MKTLINGRWTDRKDEKQSNDGSFKRKDTEFRNWITPDGSPGETGVGGFKAESRRYHLYVVSVNKKGFESIYEFPKDTFR